jgi:hypothetical protein
MASGDRSADGRGSDWLTGCEGFEVDSPGGRLGFVDRVERAEDGVPELLVVRAGMLGTRRLLIPTALIAAIVPSRRAIVIEPWSPAPARPEAA